MTGADSPVIAASLTEATPLDHLAVGRDKVTCLDQHDIAPLELGRGNGLPFGVRNVGQPLGDGFGLGLAQGRGLRLAAAFGDRFGKVGEQHREPEPEIDLEGKAQPAGAGDEVADEEHRRQAGHHLDREHHGIAHHDARIELAQSVQDGGTEDFRIAQRGDARPPPLL